MPDPKMPRITIDTNALKQEIGKVLGNVIGAATEAVLEEVEDRLQAAGVKVSETKQKVRAHRRRR